MTQRSEKHSRFDAPTVAQATASMRIMAPTSNSYVEPGFSPYGRRCNGGGRENGIYCISKRTIWMGSPSLHSLWEKYGRIQKNRLKSKYMASISAPQNKRDDVL